MDGDDDDDWSCTVFPGACAQKSWSFSTKQSGRFMGFAEQDEHEMMMMIYPWWWWFSFGEKIARHHPSRSEPSGWLARSFLALSVLKQPDVQGSASRPSSSSNAAHNEWPFRWECQKLTHGISFYSLFSLVVERSNDGSCWWWLWLIIITLYSI